MFFRDVIGQEEIKQRLIQEVNEGTFRFSLIKLKCMSYSTCPAYLRTGRGRENAVGYCIRTLHQLH